MSTISRTKHAFAGRASLPLHVVGREPAETERQVARLVAERPELQERYGGWLATLHPSAWEEIEAMARTAGRALKIDIRPAVRMMGLGTVLEQVSMIFSPTSPLANGGSGNPLAVKMLGLFRRL